MGFSAGTHQTERASEAINPKNKPQKREIEIIEGLSHTSIHALDQKRQAMSSACQVSLETLHLTQVSADRFENRVPKKPRKQKLHSVHFHCKQKHLLNAFGWWMGQFLYTKRSSLKDLWHIFKQPLQENHFLEQQSCQIHLSWKREKMLP